MSGQAVTPGESPLTVPSGAGRTADHLAFFFSQKVLAAQKSMTYTDMLAIVDLFYFKVVGILVTIPDRMN